MYRWLVGNLRLWTVQELVSSVLLCNHKSIQGETVRKVCENFQYLDMGIFVHILSGSDNMCEFCENIKNGEYVDLANSVNDLGILGDMQVGIMVWNNFDGTFTMNTSITGPFDRVEEAEININFCPICGRDLRSEENE